ncbi:pentatricopeptide repeat-containing protein At2g33680-like [Phoenix dactylifera]|uniref:Pentatricopeptide repeat-containing protein At2g33680-like n=1 Tax=Phoenix dactylifera TaxID=42345 RepID=A0A8B9AUR8_PHODC|nr:pentatricopeptide repeat-containing protein At2g33680-like [Phoenix dactylifera]
MAISSVLGHPTPCPPSNSPLAKAHRSTVPAKKAEFINNGRPDLEEAMISLEKHSLRGKKLEDPRAYYHSLISLCISHKSLHQGKRLRAHLARIGYKPGLFLDNQFINLYAKCGRVDMARELFDHLPERNVVSWNALISGYCLNACFFDAVALFGTMITIGPRPNHFTYLSALRASVGLRSLELARQIHSQLLKTALFRRTEVGNALINTYSEFGRPEDAEAVYESMVERDEVSWNSLVAVNVRNRRAERAMVVFVDMLKEGQTPNEFTFGSLLGSTDVAIIEELHAQVTKRGLGSNVFTGTALLDAYARCGDPRAAWLVFNSITQRNVIAWNSIIDALFGNNMVHEGLELFLQMSEQGTVPDDYTISILLKATIPHFSIFVGKQLHGLAIKMGLQTDTLIGNSLITMYAKLEGAAESWCVFKDISEPDIISWNSMIQSYVQNEKFEQALTLFTEMRYSEIEPDEFSFVSTLAACGSLAWHRNGKEVHCELLKRGLVRDAFVGSALIDMHAKSMAVHDARKVFDAIRNKDLITWNSMIAGFAQSGYLDEVMKLLSLIREENLEPDGFTFASILAACANATAIQQGRQVHTLILKSELNMDTAVANALITMYSRTGSIREAKKVFSKLDDKNIVSWTAMIGGFAQGGHSEEALAMFDQMENTGVKPNGKTFVTLLTACSYAGMSSEAAKYFKLMEAKYGIRPGFDHYACMVDILGRAGRLNEAEDLIRQMPFEPDALVWRMLLSACRIHGDLDRGQRSMERILAIEPGDSAAYVLLSNLYAALGHWDGVVEVRQLMRKHGVKKEPGKSWIELHNAIHEFMAGDRLHPQADEIYMNLRGLFKQMKDEGYAPGIECIGGVGKYKR